jgi:hypothetical protein
MKMSPVQVVWWTWCLRCSICVQSHIYECIKFIMDENIFVIRMASVCLPACLWQPQIVGKLRQKLEIFAKTCGDFWEWHAKLNRINGGGGGTYASVEIVVFYFAFNIYTIAPSEVLKFVDWTFSGIIQDDQKVSVHLIITIEKVRSNVQNVRHQSPGTEGH